MIITAPVTDYIPASILTTLNDKVIRGAAIPERIAEIDWRGVHFGNDTSAASEAKVITGVGFTPKIVLFIGGETTSANQNVSWGFDDGITAYCHWFRDDGLNQGAEFTESIYVRKDSSNHIVGHITTMGVDGFTITFVMTGSIAVAFMYLCLS